MVKKQNQNTVNQRGLALRSSAWRDLRAAFFKHHLSQQIRRGLNGRFAPSETFSPEPEHHSQARGSAAGNKDSVPSDLVDAQQLGQVNIEKGKA
ncbi:hypothetical protein N9S00_07010 [Luminiphilus sp.]|nr:hypothetical protein [Luminiphilus sp.]